MKPSSRTLAGRMAAVQTVVTVVALVVVGIATAVAMSFLLRRHTDDLVMDVATRVAGVMERLPAETTDPTWIAYEAEEQRSAGMRIEVRSADDRLLAAVGENFDLPPTQSGCGDRGPVRVCGTRTARYAVVVAAPHSTDGVALRYLALVLVAVTLAAAGVVAVLGRRGARRAMQPLSSLAARSASIVPGTGGRLAQRSGLAELDALAARFDDLLARFDDALERERRLAAQASHELRTPLMLARAEIETLGEPGADPEAIARALKAVDRLSQLVEALLWFAKAQERLDDATMDVVNLADLVRVEVAVHRRGGATQDIVCDLPDEALVRGDERLLARVTANLLDNALKYGQGQQIRIQARRIESRLEVTISNSGSLAPEVRPRLFEPFFRSNGAALEATGFGLGLPFARAVARAHGGDIGLEEGRPGQTSFVLALPLVAWTDIADAGVGT